MTLSNCMILFVRGTSINTKLLVLLLLVLQHQLSIILDSLFLLLSHCSLPVIACLWLFSW